MKVRMMMNSTQEQMHLHILLIQHAQQAVFAT